MLNLKKTQGIFSWVVILSECSHVFCCVLPSVFSIITLLAGIGVIGAMPIWMEVLHDTLHGYEISLMIFSGAVVLIGWGLHYISKKIDCHDTGCGHGACAPKKSRSEKILIAATMLFLLNVGIYFSIHQDVTGVLGHIAEHNISEQDEDHG